MTYSAPQSHLLLGALASCSSPCCLPPVTTARTLCCTAEHAFKSRCCLQGNLASLPTSISQLSRLESLDLRVCEQLQDLPDALCSLASLRTLVLRWCANLHALPQCIGALTRLQALDLAGCTQLAALPPSIRHLAALQALGLWGCEQLQALPESIGSLAKLQTLVLAECTKLRALPESIGGLAALHTLDATGCAQLQALPESIGGLVSLEVLGLQRCTQLRALPESIGGLINLQMLDATGCTNLQALPESIGGLINLQTLSLQRCTHLRALPESIGGLISLQVLNLDGCHQLRALPASIAQLPSLLALHVGECPLQPLPLDALPPDLQRWRRARFVLGQEETLQRSMAAISWVAILLATATFVGFLTVPGGDTGDLVRVGEDGGGGAVRQAALCAYFVSNFATFLLALSTTVFVVAQNLPWDSLLNADHVFWTIVVSAVLLGLTVLGGACTFLSGAFAVYPSGYAADLIAPACILGPVLVGVLVWLAVRVGRLGRTLRWGLARKGGALARHPLAQLPTDLGASDTQLLRDILLELRALGSSNMGGGRANRGTDEDC